MTAHRTARIARLLLRALAAPALALACLALAAPARAGQWTLDHLETTDQATYDRSGTAHTFTLPDALLYVQGNWLLEVSADGTSTAAWSGTTTAVFVWQPASPGDPPQDLHVLLDASAQAQAYGTGAAVQADDGLGDTAAAWAGDPQTPPLSGTYSGGLHLRTFAAGQAVADGSGRVTMRVPVTQSSSATATPPLSYGYNAYAYLFMQASTDSRAISISSNFDPTSYKSRVAPGYLDANGDPIFVKTAHAQVPGGSMSGDIALPYGYNEPSTYNYSPVTYHAVPSGGWSANGAEYNWFSSLKQSGDNGNVTLSNPIIPGFTNEYAEPISSQVSTSSPPTISSGDTGQTDHIHLTYTDSGNDGAEATGDYYMTLHKPEEFGPSAKSTVLVTGLPANFYYVPITPTPANPGYAIYPGGIACTWNAPGAYWEWGSDALSVLSNSGPVWLQDFLTAANIALSKLEPQPYNGTAPWAWNDPNSTFPANHPKGTIYPQQLYHMVPMLNEMYKMHYTLDDHYDTGGYEGTSLIPASDDQGPAEWYGNFVYYGH